jgi:hypothetical protein
MRCFAFLFIPAITMSGESAAAPTAQAFGTLPAVYDAAISPDGKQIASIVNINGTYGVRVITIGK